MHPSLMNTYNPLNVQFTHGKGAALWDTEGKEYLDALGGIAVNALGHNHPAITDAITTQAHKLLHVSNVYEIPEQHALADKLCEMSGMERVFFSNSGAEANEAAIKLCRLYGHQKGIDIPNIVVMEHAFHGRTIACLSACGSRKIHSGFEPLTQGFIRAPFNDISAIETIAHNNQDVVAVMLEPIQGEGGLRVPDQDYIKQLRQLCNQQGWLLVLDEVQSGIGRTGSFFAYQQEDCLPDIVTSAKALGNGIPIGACLAQGLASELFQPGSHGSTFGGNPFACQVALTVLNTIDANGLCQQAAVRGKQIKSQLEALLADNDHVVEIRGRGLMIGIELDQPARQLLQVGLEKGILFSVTSDSVIRLLPPYIISEQQAEEIAKRVTECIQSL